MKKSKNTLLVKTSTWNKESTELLDYESQDLIKANFTSKSESFLIRQANNVRLVRNLQEKDSNTGSLLKLSFDVNNFYININEAKRDEKDKNSFINWGEVSWFIVKMLKSSEGETGYRLNPGDMIKLGRIKLRICDIKLPGYEEKENKNNDNQNNNKNYNFEKENMCKDNLNIELKNRTSSNLKNLIVNVNDELVNKAKKETEKSNKQNTEKAIKETNRLNNSDRKRSMCRICYCSEKELDSPLIRPCNCSGTMKYIHFCCLQKWLKSKIIVKTSSNESTITYSFKLVECELCKTLLPDFIKYKNNIYEIWDFTKPTFKHYISFETVTADRNNKILYIVNLENKAALKIGRGHDSDVRITDISVSRFHSQIRKTNDGKLILEDNNSKFGTLALIQNPKLNILQDRPLSIQIGRTILNFNVKLPCSVFGCLFRNSNKELKAIDYQFLNLKSVSRQNHNNIKIQNEEEESEYSFTEELETEKDKELKIQTNQINIDQNTILNAHLKPLEESKQTEIELTHSRNINALNNNNINDDLNNQNSNLYRSPYNQNSNIIIIEQDESREIRLRESEIFNKILDPNLKTERDNEKQIMEIIEKIENQNKKEEAEEEVEVEIINNVHLDNKKNSSERISIAENNILNNNNNEYKLDRTVSKKIKDEIDLKILDLKNLNMIMKNKLEEVESVKKTKTSKRKENKIKNIKSKKNKKEFKVLENTDKNPRNSELSEEAKAKEEEEIEENIPKECLTLREIKLITSKSQSHKKFFENLEIENNNNCFNSNPNLNDFLKKDDNSHASDSQTNLNNFLNNAELSFHIRNKNHQVRLENKKTGDFTAMNSFVQNNLNNNNNNNNDLNLININNNNYLVNNETDNEQVFYHEDNVDKHNYNYNNNNNNNLENQTKFEAENEYNSKNLVLNAVININEIDNFANNIDLNDNINENNKNNYNQAYYSATKSAAIKSLSDNLEDLCFKNLNSCFENEHLNSIENSRKISSGNAVSFKNNSKHNNNLFESREKIELKRNLKTNEIEQELKNDAIADNISSSNDENSVKAQEENLNSLSSEQEKIKIAKQENFTNATSKGMKAKDCSLSGKSNSSGKPERNANKALEGKESLPNQLNKRKSFLEDFEFVNSFNKKKINNYKNKNSNLDFIEKNKSVNSEDQIINKKNLIQIKVPNADDKSKINHYSENLSNVLKAMKQREFNSDDKN